MKISMHRFFTFLLIPFAVSMILFVPQAENRHQLISSSCDSGCSIAAGTFEVQEGMNAVNLKIVSMLPGRSCGDRKKTFSAGFSIESKGTVIFTYYLTPEGNISDPVPLNEVVLEPGRYQLMSSRAAGSRVKISFELVNSAEETEPESD